MNDKIDLQIPETAIAKFPIPGRTSSKLMCLFKNNNLILDRQFFHITSMLKPGDLLILNDSKVMAARLYGHKASGGKLEVLVERVISHDLIRCFIRSSKAPKVGAQIIVAEQVATVLDFDSALAIYTLKFENANVYDLMATAGEIPLPPYLKREVIASDYETYQTVYAQEFGSVAAPTAGLHFSTELLAELQTRGVQLGYLTLHVGAGTFAPIRENDLDKHVMHYEHLTVSQDLVDLILKTKQAGSKVICVGTTSVRALETAALTGKLAPFEGETNLFIRPGFKFNVADALITNFHLPETTLVQLVAAFVGVEQLIKAYRHALAHNYRFYSYGDAMFIDLGEKLAI